MVQKPRKVRVSTCTTHSSKDVILGDSNLGTGRYITLAIEDDYRNEPNEDLPRILIRVALTESTLKSIMSGRGQEFVGSLDTFNGQGYELVHSDAAGAIKGAKDAMIASITAKLKSSIDKLKEAQLIVQNSKATKKDIGNINQLTSIAIQEISKNIPYLIEVASENLDKVSQEAVDNATSAIQEYVQGLGIKKHKALAKKALQLQKGAK